jgi:type IV pilus biogenesis protein PilP
VVDGDYTVLIGRPAAMPAPRPGGAFDGATSQDDQSAAPQDSSEPEPQVTRSELPDSTGLLVIPGRPAVETRPRPSLTDLTPAEPVDPATDILRRIRPVERPETAATLAVATPEEALPAELAVLRRVRPVERPASVAQAEASARAAIEAAQAAAAVDAAAQSAAASLAQAAAAAAVAPISDLALPQSARPQTRPRDVERIAARMAQQRREQQAAAPQPQTVARAQQQAAPQIRSAGGNVAAAATERNALRLNETNLIGVYGRPNARRALVRLRNGRYVKVEVGDRLDRGRVTAIGDDRLQYQRGNRNVVLQLPRT